MVVDIKVNQHELHLLLNGEALFNFYERYGKEKTLLAQLEADDKEGFERMVWLLCELALQGELYRRYQGEDRGKIFPYNQALAEILPGDIPRIKLALTMAIREGFARQHPSDEDLDPWLAEIEKKKKAQPVRSISEWLRDAWGSRSGKA